MYLKTLLLCVMLLLITALHGQTLLKDIETLPNSGSAPNNWSATSNDLFIFEALHASTNQSLFASDGTEAGTIALGAYQVDTDIIQFGGKAYFGACDLFLSVDSCFSLFTSDGTVEGTTFFFDLDPGGISMGVTDIVAGDNLFYFAGQTIAHGYELYRSDGTISGTYQIADIAPGFTSGYAGELVVINDVAFFAGYTDEAGIEPWRSDGTAAGTYMITDLNTGTASGFPSDFTASGGYIYFSGLGTGTGFEVRRTNGDQGNVELIGEMGTTDSSVPRDFVDSDGRLYYAAEGNDQAGYDLFVYDHVGAPLHLDLASGDIFPRALMPFGDGELIFTAENDSGRELWRSDGTIAGTHMIIDLYPGEMDGVFGTGTVGGSFFMCGDSLVYFAGADGVNAVGEFVYELFVTDGTAAGTQLVSDHYPGAQGSNPGNFFEFGNRIYFAATDPVVNREPFYLEKGTVSSVSDHEPVIQITASAYPNPVQVGGMFNVNFNVSEGTILQSEIIDILGRPISSNLNLGYISAGSHRLQVMVNDYSSGIYQLVIRVKNGQTEIPFIVK